eukprot:PhF_6_TR26365/c0_g1_i1/m.37996
MNKRSGPPPPMRAWAPPVDVQGATQNLTSILQQHQSLRATTPRSKEPEASPHERPPSPRLRTTMLAAQKDLLDRVAQDAEERVTRMLDEHQKEMQSAREISAELQKRIARNEIEMRAMQLECETLSAANQELEEETELYREKCLGLEGTIEDMKAQYLKIAEQWEHQQVNLPVNKKTTTNDPPTPGAVHPPASVELSDLFRTRAQAVGSLVQSAAAHHVTKDEITPTKSAGRPASLQDIQFRISANALELESLCNLSTDDDKVTDMLRRQCAELRQEVDETHMELNRVVKTSAAVEKDFRTTLDRSANELLTAHSQLQEFTQRLRTKDEENELLMKKFQDTQQREKKLQESISTLEAQYRNDVDEKDRQVNEWKRKYETVQGASESTTKSIQQQQDALSQQLDDALKTVRTLSEEAVVSKARTDELNRANSDLQATLKDSNSANEQLEQKQKELSNQVQSLSKENDSLRIEISTLKTQLQASETANTSLQADLKRVQESATKAQNDLKRQLEDALDQQRLQGTEGNVEMQKLLNAKSSLEDALESEKRTVQTLEEAVTQLTSENQVLQDQDRANQTLIGSLTLQVEELTHQLNSSKQQLQTAENERGTLHGEVQHLTQAVRTVDDLKNSVTAQLREAESLCAKQSLHLEELEQLRMTVKDKDRIIAELQSSASSKVVVAQHSPTALGKQNESFNQENFKGLANILQSLRDCEKGKDQALNLAEQYENDMKDVIEVMKQKADMTKKIRDLEADVEFRKGRVTEAKNQLAEKNKTYSALESKLTEVAGILKAHNVPPPGWMPNYRF